MTFSGKVEAIYIGPDPQAPMRPVEQVRAVAGRGLEGDRYFKGEGTFYKKDKPGRAVTLIEAESVEAAERDYGVAVDAADTRRNIVTRGVPLDHLVGKEFAVGGVRMQGVKLAEPCGHLERLTDKELRKPLIHRGGLRAEILNDGTIRVGDPVSSL